MVRRAACFALSMIATVVAFALERPVSNAQGPAGEGELLLKLDREFDQATAEKGIEGWVAYFAENGSMLGATEPPVTGPNAIRQYMGPALAEAGFSLRWQPTKAEMMIPSIVGYTVGRFERKRKNEQGKTLLVRGSYVTVWRKQADGSWKIILDTGHPDGPPTVVE